jgi:hypothetical protein
MQAILDFEPPKDLSLGLVKSTSLAEAGEATSKNTDGTDLAGLDLQRD